MNPLSTKPERCLCEKVKILNENDIKTKTRDPDSQNCPTVQPEERVQEVQDPKK